MANRRSSTIRKVHALLGIISALNLFLLITTGLLLQHINGLRLDEHLVSRRWLPANYRPQDGTEGVRADIVITDLHTGRIVGPVGTAILDVLTLGWLILLGTGLVIYTTRANGRRKGPAPDTSERTRRTPGERMSMDNATKMSPRTRARVGVDATPGPTNSSYLLRCCPAICPLAAKNVAVMHLSDVGLRGALHALAHLWTKPAATQLPQKTTLVVCAYRCRDGHCHLLCQSPGDLCRTEESALLLLEVITDAANRQVNGFAGFPVGPQPESKRGRIV